METGTEVELESLHEDVLVRITNECSLNTLSAFHNTSTKCRALANNTRPHLTNLKFMLNDQCLSISLTEKVNGKTTEYQSKTPDTLFTCQMSENDHMTLEEALFLDLSYIQTGISKLKEIVNHTSMVDKFEIKGSVSLHLYLTVFEEKRAEINNLSCSVKKPVNVRVLDLDCRRRIAAFLLPCVNIPVEKLMYLFYEEEEDDFIGRLAHARAVQNLPLGSAPPQVGLKNITEYLHAFPEKIILRNYTIKQKTIAYLIRIFLSAPSQCRFEIHVYTPKLQEVWDNMKQAVKQFTPSTITEDEPNKTMIVIYRNCHVTKNLHLELKNGIFEIYLIEKQ